MKVTIELTSINEIETVVAALKGMNTQAVLNFAPKAAETAVAAETGKTETPSKTEAKRGRKPKETQAAETAETTQASTEEVQSEAKNDDTVTEAAQASTVEPQEGDIDDAKMREIGGKLLRELNGKGKDGVGKLSEILSSLGSKKVTEVPMNLRPRFVAKVEEALK